MKRQVSLGGRRSFLILCSPHLKPARERAKGAGDTELAGHLYFCVIGRFPVCASLGRGQDKKLGRRGHQDTWLCLEPCSSKIDTSEGHTIVIMAPVLAQLGLRGPILSNCPLWLLRWFCSEGEMSGCADGSRLRASLKVLDCN